VLIGTTRSEDLSIGPYQCDAYEKGESFQYQNLFNLHILQILKKEKMPKLNMLNFCPQQNEEATAQKRMRKLEFCCQT
jgi:hypothetical protein